MKIIGITGGAGFVGRHLTALLINKGYDVIIFTRNITGKKAIPHVLYAHWDAEKEICDTVSLGKVDAIVHLAGEGIADKRWTDKRKQEIVGSRVKGTRFLVSQLKEYAPSCKVLVSASATGFYGPDMSGMIPFKETDAAYTDFLGDTCKRWEAESEKAQSLMRIVILRFGIVLGKDSGAFKEFEKPMSFGVMPILGSGRQVVSWIEVDDLARLILFSIENELMNGIYNAVAPHPVSHTELMKAIGKEKGGLKIPVPVPAFILKIMLGEMSEEVLKSCAVSADKVLGSGFKFQYPEIDKAVKGILGKMN